MLFISFDLFFSVFQHDYIFQNNPNDKTDFTSRLVICNFFYADALGKMKMEQEMVKK